MDSQFLIDVIKTVFFMMLTFEKIIVPSRFDSLGFENEFVFHVLSQFHVLDFAYFLEIFLS